jgi:hypothetical protein
MVSREFFEEFRPGSKIIRPGSESLKEHQETDGLVR